MDHLESNKVSIRDHGIPVVKIEDTESSDSDRGTDSKPANPRKPVSGSKLRDKMKEASNASALGIQDRLFSVLFQQIVPADTSQIDDGKKDRRSKSSGERPNFSIPIMSSNFRRFNARIGVVFVFQNKMMRLFAWKKPTHTLSFLAVYTFCCLDPTLLAVLPLVLCLFAVMVPSFLARHPPPPTDGLGDYQVIGPASAPPTTIKPAPDMSKDFFRNMRDLQNSMGDFSVLHDQLIRLIAPVTNFSNEHLSSVLFHVLLLVSCSMFIASNLVPWRAVLLAIGWLVTLIGHPAAKSILSPADKERIKHHGKHIHQKISRWMEHDIILDEAPETREVEIFELQRRRDDDAEWEAWLFSGLPYDPLSPVRLSGDRPRGTRFFEDVAPPKGWAWKDKKWKLDMQSRNWVEERMITGVEVEIEGERWVYDIGDDETETNHGSKGSRQGKGSSRKIDWEEGTGTGPKGEWRRRRWVRLVKRRVTTTREAMIVSNDAD